MLAQALLELAPPFQSLCVVTAALLVERFISIPAAFHPMTLVRAIANQLAHKVNHPERHDPNQQHVAGILALSLMLLLCIPVPLILLQFSPLPLAVEILLLLCCFSWRPLRQQLGQLSQANAQQHKQLRRDLLSRWLARDCENLSAMGLRKAAIEAVYLRSWHDQVAILFWYLLAGIWAALTYKIVLEVSRCWHPKHKQTLSFGAPAKHFRALLDAIPQSLWAGWLLLTTLRKPLKQNLSQLTQFDSRPRALLLLAANAQHQCNTGGPAYYAGIKLNRPRLVGTIEPQEAQIATALRSVNLRITLLLCTLWLCQAMLVALRSLS